MGRNVIAVSLLAAGALLLPGTASAVDVGVRFGLYTDVDEPFAGVELITPVAHRIYFNPNFEWVFTEGFDYMTLNGDFHYDFPTRRNLFVWLGAGLGLVRIDFEGDDNGDTDAAFNVLGGLGWRAGSVIPYVQAKVIVKDDSEFVIGVGLRF